MSNEKFSVVPPATAYTVYDAREWFGKLYDLGISGFHADDIHHPKPNEESEFGHLFTPEAEKIWIDTVASFRNASEEWPNPDLLYDLVGEGRFAAEQAYPHLVIDTVLPMASRSRYSPLPGQSKPTIVVEECNEFVAIEVDTPTGRLSDATSFLVIPLENAGHTPTGIEVDNAILHRDEAIVVNSIEELEEVVEDYMARKVGLRP